MSGVSRAADDPRLGPRFAAGVGDRTGPGWLTATELFGAGLADAVEGARVARSVPTAAVAGSLLLTAYANRVTAPVVAALHYDGTELDARLADVRVRLADGMVAEVSFVAAPRPAGPQTEARIAEQLFGGHLAIAVDAVHAATRAGRRVLWSDVAISVAGAFLALSWAGPGRAGRLAAAQRFLAREPRAAGVVTLRTAQCVGVDWMYNERHACCLAFRSTLENRRDQPFCGNCNIPDEAYRVARFEAAATRYAEHFPE